MKYILIVNEKRLNEFIMVHPTTWTYNRNFTCFYFNKVQFPCVVLLNENKICKALFDENSTIAFDGYVSLDGYLRWKSGFLFNGEVTLSNNLADKNILPNGSVVLSAKKGVEILRKMHEETVLFSVEKVQEKESISKSIDDSCIELVKKFKELHFSLSKAIIEFAKFMERGKNMKKIIPLPSLVTSDGQQQFLTKKGDAYFASRRDRSLKQVFTQEEYEIVPDLYKPLAKDAEDEFRLEIVPGRWLYVYDGDYGITGDKNMADIFSESDIAFLKNNPDLHIDFETALVRMID